MLKNIRLHIEKDDEKQEALEAKLAATLQTVHKDNINAFQRNIPSLMPYINQTQSQNLSIFCNKLGHFNFVDYGLGRVLYGFNPEQDAQKQVDAFLQHGHFVPLATEQKTETSPQTHTNVVPELLSSLPKLQQYLSTPPVPNRVDCLVILGIGMGHHVKALLAACQPKFVILYEPEDQYFSASSLVFDWKSVLSYAKKHDITLFFMVEKDGRDLVADIQELHEHYPFFGFYLYKHYNHPIFTSIQKQLTDNSWESVKNNGFHFEMSVDANHYTQIFSDTTSLEQYQPVNTSNELYQKNLKAFETFFPDIAKQFKGYEPKVWLPVQTPEGDINLVNKDNLVCWYSDSPKNDCLTNFQGFSEQPNKDGLILGYKGKKLAHYMHYKFVKQTEELIEAVEDEEGVLPQNIQSMIMFGLGVGYQLEALTEQHSLEKLFLCEPNPDFFHASLFAIDWKKVFKAIDEEKGKLYINIGDDGTNLFRDLLNQFYSIGPYILNNTFFYQSYYNASLNTAIAKLREQLQVVITMGEYFDHAYHGIAQTKEALKRGIPNLVSKPAQKLDFADKEVPVFLVGNGPSLDQSFEVIREWQDQALIISCGTALQVLHRNGIVPDFHAEIEQNRASYDWACMINDFDYLKQVSLVSCNGIHPDTCSLYKDVYVAFKEGESSTVSALQIVGEKNYSVLQFAFPTVANFACDLFTTLGFKNLYFIGVDMGFISDKRHHSRQSAYYLEDGEEMYNYSDTINTAFVVPGNFRKTVMTKHEFKIAKMVLEQAIASSSKDTSYYNCSDGAQIVGATPLKIDNVLVTASPEDKQHAINKLKTDAFISVDGNDVVRRYEERYASKVLGKELEGFSKWMDKPVNSIADAESLVDQQKNMLFLSYQNGRSLLFYYLYGTVNFANAMLIKLLYSSKEKGVEQFCKGLDIWKEYFQKFQALITLEQSPFDVSTSPNNLLQRANNRLSYAYRGKRIAVVTNSSAYLQAVQYAFNAMLEQPDTEICFGDIQQLPELMAKAHHSPFDYVYYYFTDEFDAPQLTSPEQIVRTLTLRGNTSTLYTDNQLNREQLLELHHQWLGNLMVLKYANDNRSFMEYNWMSDKARIGIGSVYCAVDQHYHVALLKYVVIDDYDEVEFAQAMNLACDENDAIYTHQRQICIDFNQEKHFDGLMDIGDRGKSLPTLNSKDFVAATITRERLQVCYNDMSRLIPKVVSDMPLNNSSTS